MCSLPSQLHSRCSFFSALKHSAQCPWLQKVGTHVFSWRQAMILPVPEELSQVLSKILGYCVLVISGVKATTGEGVQDA